MEDKVHDWICRNQKSQEVILDELRPCDNNNGGQ